MQPAAPTRQLVDLTVRPCYVCRLAASKAGFAVERSGRQCMSENVQALLCAEVGSGEWGGEWGGE
jgi:hypothetical protein